MRKSSTLLQFQTKYIQKPEMGAQQAKLELKSPSLNTKPKTTIKNKERDSRTHGNSGNIFTAHTGLIYYCI